MEKVVAHARTQRFFERAATATARPRGKPMGRQLKARAMVTMAPASNAEPQPPLAKERSES